nr:VOC family protein [Cytobacillus oceanisediminis]
MKPFGRQSYGEGVHHISFVVENFDGKIRLLKEMGFPVIQTGNCFNGKGRYAYMDTTSTFKVIIELLERYLNLLLRLHDKSAAVF